MKKTQSYLLILLLGTICGSAVLSVSAERNLAPKKQTQKTQPVGPGKQTAKELGMKAQIRQIENRLLTTYDDREQGVHKKWGLTDSLLTGPHKGFLRGFAANDSYKADKQNWQTLLKDVRTLIQEELKKDETRQKAQKLSSTNKNVFLDASGRPSKQDPTGWNTCTPNLLLKAIFNSAEAVQALPETPSTENLKKLSEQVAALKKIAQLSNLYSLPKEMAKSGSTWPAKDNPETTALRKMLGTLYGEIGKLYDFVIRNLESVIKEGPVKEKSVADLVGTAQKIGTNFKVATKKLLSPEKKAAGILSSNFDAGLKQKLYTLSKNAAMLLQQELEKSRKTLSRTNAHDFMEGQTKPERLLKRVFITAGKMREATTLENRKELINDLKKDTQSEELKKLSEHMRKSGSSWLAKDSSDSTALRNMLATIYEEIGKIYAQVLKEVEM